MFDGRYILKIHSSSSFFFFPNIGTISDSKEEVHPHSVKPEVVEQKGSLEASFSPY